MCDDCGKTPEIAELIDAKVEKLIDRFYLFFDSNRISINSTLADGEEPLVEWTKEELESARGLLSAFVWFTTADMAKNPVTDLINHAWLHHVSQAAEDRHIGI